MSDTGQSDLRDLVGAAEEVARAAGDYLRSVQPQISHEKSAGNLVTDADLAAERIILERLRASFPQHAILSEETAAEVPLDAEHLWIVDPLDGTNNFAHQIPQFCVSIAYAQRGIVRAGVVFDPNRQELFCSGVGRGATMNGQPIQVATRPLLAESIVSTGFYYDRGALMRRTLQSIETLFSTGVRGVRRFGSAALDLCWVACGRVDGYFEYQLAPWDFAAGAYLVQAAGGLVTDRSGAPLRLDGAGVIAASSAVHPALVEKVRWPVD